MSARTKRDISVQKEMSTPGSGKIWTGAPTRAKTPRWLVKREIEREDLRLAVTEK